MAAQALGMIGVVLVFLWVFWGLPKEGRPTLEFDLWLLAKCYLLLAIYFLYHRFK